MNETRQRMKGVGEQVKGKVREVGGAITGDTSEEMRGKHLTLSDYLDRNYIHRSEEMTPDRRQDLETIFNHNLVRSFHKGRGVIDVQEGLRAKTSSGHVCSAGWIIGLAGEQDAA